MLLSRFAVPEDAGLRPRLLSPASFPPIPTTHPLLPGRAHSPTPLNSREGTRTQTLQSRAPRAEGTQRRPRLLTPQAFLSYLPSFQGSSRTPDLVSAQAHQNSPSRLPRSRHPGDRAHSDQSATAGRGFSEAILCQREAGWLRHVIEAELSPGSEVPGKLVNFLPGSDWVRPPWEAGPVDRKGLEQI